MKKPQVHKIYNISLNGELIPNINILSRKIGIPAQTLYSKLRNHNYIIDETLNGFVVKVTVYVE